VESQNFQDRVEATLAFRCGLEDGIHDEKVAVGLAVPDFDLSDDEFTEDKFLVFWIVSNVVVCSKSPLQKPHGLRLRQAEDWRRRLWC
jgi:hypothetical protein